jgi:hypothetical protein
MGHSHGEGTGLDLVASLYGAKEAGPRWSTLVSASHRFFNNFNERDTGLEPATFGLGSRRSTN